MSDLRIFGLLLGIIGVYLAFLKYRGVNWHKGQFVMATSLAGSLMLISIEPGAVDFLPELFSMQANERGRLLALMLLAIIFLLYMQVESRGKYVRLNRQFDRVVRSLSLSSIALDYRDRYKPIMILIPAYNEAENLELLLKKLPSKVSGLDVGCLVVDDGSEDATRDVVERHGFLCVSNLVNRGQGSASRLGYEMLKGENVVVVVTLDADNQHDPSDIEKIVTPILKKESQLVIGSRRLGTEEHESAVRRAGVIILTAIINFITGQKLTDCSSGYKAFSIDGLNKITLYEDQYQSAEVIICAAKAGLTISEVPVSISLRSYGETKKGSSFRYGLNFCKVLVKSWWR